MTSEELYDVIGERSDDLVQEAVWRLKRIRNRWPRWQEASNELAKFPSVPSAQEAERRVEEAVRDGDVIVRLVRDGQDFRIELDRDTEDAIARRMLDHGMPRKEEESW
jgi:hypothetical protein